MNSKRKRNSDDVRRKQKTSEKRRQESCIPFSPDPSTGWPLLTSQFAVLKEPLPFLPPVSVIWSSIYQEPPGRLRCCECCSFISDLKIRLSWGKISPIQDSGFPGGTVLRNPPANAGDACSIPRLKRSPEGGNAWEIPWTEQPGGLQSLGS